MIEKIKTYIMGVLILISITGGIVSYITIKNNHTLKQNWSTSENNFKASNRLNIVYKVTMDQIKNSKDSVDIKLLKYSKESKIKDSKIQTLTYLSQRTIKGDTVRLSDTIFVKKFKLDTIIGDKWITKRLHLEYPNIISIQDSIRNEILYIISSKKETIKPPRKCFILRWFQAKQILLEINIKNSNPYIINDKVKVIEIVK